MTEEYMRTFTSLGDMLRSAGKGGWGSHGGEEISRHIEKRIHSKCMRKRNNFLFPKWG
jgi:hypothetical protein